MAWLMHCENHIQVDTSNLYKLINQWHISHPWISVFLYQFQPQLLILSTMIFQMLFIVCDNVLSSHRKNLVHTVRKGHDNSVMAPKWLVNQVIVRNETNVSISKCVHITLVSVVIVCLHNCTADMWIGIPITTLSIVNGQSCHLIVIQYQPTSLGLLATLRVPFLWSVCQIKQICSQM